MIILSVNQCEYNYFIQLHCIKVVAYLRMLYLAIEGLGSLRACNENLLIIILGYIKVMA